MTLLIISIAAGDYDLAATLASGQSFRWRRSGEAWEGVIGSRWVRLRQHPGALLAETTAPPADWQWLRDYLQTGIHWRQIVASFPDDPPMRASVAACRGLRLLRQEPWECLASFICSSTKQIVQIEQIVALLCTRFGEPLPVPERSEPAWAFPGFDRLAAVSEAELRSCKLGFRAPYLGATARELAAGRIDLARLGDLPLEQARACLLTLPGVGPKIADCVLLFAYGFQEAFPVECSGPAGFAPALFPPPPSQPPPPAPVRPRTFWPPRRLRPAVPLSLHANNPAARPRAIKPEILRCFR